MENSFSNHKKLLFLGIFFSILLKLLFFFIIYNYNENFYVFADQSKYLDLSEKLLAGNFFDKSFGALRMPIYLIFLALSKLIFQNNIYLIIIFQIFLGSILLFLVYKIASFVNKNVAIISLFLSSISIGFINASIFILTEAIFLIFFLSFFLNLLNFLFQNSDQFKLKPLIYCAVFFSLSTLTRPITFYFIILILFFFQYFSLKSSLKYISIFFIIFSIVISPWCLRNYKNFGFYKLDASIGPNLIGYYLPYFYSVDNKISQTEVKKYIDNLIEEADHPNPFKASDNAKKIFFKEINSLSINSILIPYFSGTIKHLFSPAIIETLYMANIKKTNFSQIQEYKFFKKAYIFLFKNENKLYSSVVIFFSIFSIISIILAFSSFFFLKEKKNKTIFFIFLIVILLNLILVGPLGSPRYRLIIDPFLIIMLSYSILKIFSKNKINE